MPTADFRHATHQTKALPVDLEVKSGDWELKSVDDNGEFLIYMAAFGNRDRGGDVIEPGAFENLAEYNRSGWIGVNHDMEKLPVAYPISASQDTKGLLIRGKFHSTPAGQEARTVVKERKAAGKAVFGSIGYKVNPNGASFDGGGNGQIRRLKSISLYEASFVNLPMNPDAEVISAKSLGGINMKEKTITIDALKAWLDGQTKTGRVLSKENHAMLKCWHKSLNETCSHMKSVIDQYDPGNANPGDVDSGVTNPDDGQEPGIDNPTSDKDLVNQRRTAGNAIPADQNPRGEQTAESMAKDKEKKLFELRRQQDEKLAILRARTLQDIHRFVTV